MNVAFFGGTFDPPHRGHIGIAKAAVDAFPLDDIMFAPVGNQPLKPGVTMTSFEDRLAMVTLACQECQPSLTDPVRYGSTHFSPSAIDQPKPNGEPNYTVDTLALFRNKMPQVN